MYGYPCESRTPPGSPSRPPAHAGGLCFLGGVGIFLIFVDQLCVFAIVLFIIILVNILCEEESLLCCKTRITLLGLIWK